MNQQRRRALRQIGGTMAATMLDAGVARAAQGQFPFAPLRFIVPVGPGSSADSSTRYIAERIGRMLGQPAIVENRPGADFLIGVQALLAAPPDGHTLMLISQTSMVVNPIIHKNLPYEPLRDIRPLVASVGAAATLVTGARSRFRSVADVLAAARQAPRTVSMGYYGQFYRVGGLMMEDMGKVRFSHVPYKSPPQEISDLIGGSLDVAFIDTGAALPLVRSGQLRALAVSSLSRQADLPDVPTLHESGLRGFDLFIWIGYGVSAKVPEARAQALQAALGRVMAQPDFRSFSARNGNMRVLATPGQELAQRIAAESARFRDLLEAAERGGS